MLQITLPTRTRKLFKNVAEFSLKKPIGSGAFSTVYKVLHKQSQKTYALKIVDLQKLGPLDKQNVEKEVKIHSQMEHRHIIGLIDYFIEENTVYIVLEYCKRGNLFRYLNRNSRIRETEIKRFFEQTCQAIEYMHSSGLINRDIKPENILLDDDMNVKVCDFGWSCHKTDDNYKRLKAGTYAYMSPESLMGLSQDESSDVWSLGILLYELLFKREPYRGTSTNELLTQIKLKPLDFTQRDIFPKAKILIIQLLQQNKAKRPTVGDILNSSFLKELDQDSHQRFCNTTATNLDAKKHLNLMLAHSPQVGGNTSNYGFKNTTPKSIHRQPSAFDIAKPQYFNTNFESRHVSQDINVKSRHIQLNTSQMAQTSNDGRLLNKNRTILYDSPNNNIDNDYAIRRGALTNHYKPTDFNIIERKAEYGLDCNPIRIRTSSKLIHKAPSNNDLVYYERVDDFRPTNSSKYNSYYQQNNL